MHHHWCIEQCLRNQPRNNVDNLIDVDQVDALPALLGLPNRCQRIGEVEDLAQRHQPAHAAIVAKARVVKPCQAAHRDHVLRDPTVEVLSTPALHHEIGLDRPLGQHLDGLEQAA